MAGKRGRPRKSINMNDIDESDSLIRNECVSSQTLKNERFLKPFKMEEVKENLRTISERCLKWIIEGVFTERREKAHEMSSSVREMRAFLIEKKTAVENSKSSRKRKTLETISSLLDSANYLMTVVKNYLDEDQELNQEQHQEVKLNESVDMFLEEKQEISSETSYSQKYMLREEQPQDTQSLRTLPSRSILKLANSETLGVAKKITFAEKATKVYEDDETSVISLAKSSPSVKSVNDYEPKAQQSQDESTETRSTSEKFETGSHASEDIFEDTESIVDSSFQEESTIPRRVNLFRWDKLINFNAEQTTAEGSSNSATNLPNETVHQQGIELDPLLKGESPNTIQIEEATNKTDETIPFHNFVLTLPNDSSSSEASLDARVNMAINLVSTQPKMSADNIGTAHHSPDGIISSKFHVPDFRWLEPMEYKEFESIQRAGTAQNSTEGIVPSSILCTDPRWLQPKEYNQGMFENPSQDSLWFEENKLPSELLEEAISLLPPFDDHKVQYVPQDGHFPSEQHERNSESHKEDNHHHHPATSAITQPGCSSNQNLPIVADSVKETLRAQVKNTKSRQTNVKNKNKTSTTVNTESNELQANSTQQNNEDTLIRFEQTHNSGDPSGYFKAQKEIEIAGVTGKNAKTSDTQLETYDSHEVAVGGQYRTRRSLAKASARAENAQKPDSADVTEPQDFTDGTCRDSWKIGRLRTFGHLWSQNGASSTPLPDKEIKQSQIISKGHKKQTKSKKRQQAEAGAKYQATRPGSKSIQNQSSHYKNFTSGTSHGSEGAGKEKQTPTGRRENEANSNLKSIDNPTFPLSTPLPDTVLVDPTAAVNFPEDVDTMNTSSMICETSFAGERSSQTPSKRGKTKQKKTNPDSNQKKRGSNMKQKLSHGTSQNAGSEELYSVQIISQCRSKTVSTDVVEDEKATQGNPKRPQGRRRATKPNKSSEKQAAQNPEKAPENSTTVDKNISQYIEPKPPQSLQSAEKQEFTQNEQKVRHPQLEQEARHPQYKQEARHLQPEQAARHPHHEQEAWHPQQHEQEAWYPQQHEREDRNLQPEQAARHPHHEQEAWHPQQHGQEAMHPQYEQEARHLQYEQDARHPHHKQEAWHPQQHKQDARHPHHEQEAWHPQYEQEAWQPHHQQDAWHPQQQQEQQSLPDCNRWLHIKPNPQMNTDQDPPGQSSLQYLSHSNPVLEQAQFTSNSNHSTQQDFLQFHQILGPSDNSKSRPTEDSHNENFGSLNDQTWHQNLQDIGQTGHQTPSNDQDQNRYLFESKPLCETSLNRFLQNTDQTSNDLGFRINSTNHQINWDFPATFQANSDQNQIHCSANQYQESNEGRTIIDQVSSAAVDSRNSYPNMKAHDEPSTSIPIPNMPSFEQHSTELSKHSVNTKRQRDQDEEKQRLSQKPKTCQRKTSVNDDIDIDVDVSTHSQGTQAIDATFEDCENLSWASDHFPNTETLDFETTDVEMFESQDIHLIKNHDPPGFNKTARPEESLHYQAKPQEYNNLGFQAQKPKANYTSQNNENTHEFSDGYDNNSQQSQPETIQKSSNTYQPICFTEFDRGIQVRSAEVNDNPKKVDPEEKMKTEAEEIEELIRNLKWVRRIPENELVEAGNIEELINDPTFVW